MKKYLTLLVVVLLLSATAPTTTAQSDAQSLSECDSDAEGFVDCIRSHTSEQDVLDWIQQRPSAVTENQQSAVSVFDLDNSSLTDQQTQQVQDWEIWANGGTQPDWFGEQASSNESELPTTVERQLTPEVSVTDYEFNRATQSANVSLHNAGEQPQTIYIIDVWSQFASGDIRHVEVTVQPGETVSVDSPAQLKEQSQVVSVQVAGDFQSATTITSGNSLPWDDEQSEWSYVWLFGVSILVAGVLALLVVAIYVMVKSGRKRFNTYDKVNERI